jgi:hypothetical protein
MWRTENRKQHIVQYLAVPVNRTVYNRICRTLPDAAVCNSPVIISRFRIRNTPSGYKQLIARIERIRSRNAYNRYPSRTGRCGYGTNGIIENHIILFL